MERKHTPGCYCCQECYQIQPEELPCLEPPEGFELYFDWNGPPCCKCIQFIKFQPAEPDVQCEDTGFLRQTATFEQNWLAKGIPPPAEVCGGNCESLVTQGAYYCCASGVFVAATSETVAEATLQYEIRHYQLEEIITVCIKKDEVVCNGVATTKWILHAKYSVVITYQHKRRQYTNELNRTFSNVAACFSINDADLPSSCDCEPNFYTETNIACDETEFGLFHSDFASAEFDYVLFFDTTDWPPEPTDTIVFDNTSKPDDCNYTICNQGENFDDEICFSISTFPAFLKPCMCESTLQCETVVIEKSLNIPCGQPVSLFGCSCDPELIAASFSCGSFDEYSCGTYSLNCISCNIVNNSAPEDCDFDASLGSPEAFALAAEFWFFLLFQASCPSSLGFSNGPTCGGSNYCALPENCFGRAPCGPCCSEYGDCQCAVKSATADVELTSYTHEFECTWTPWERCFTRPSLTFKVIECE
jgi:hypothetical protein